MFTAPTLQVLWSSKVKFISLTRFLVYPCLGITLVFSQLQVLLSHLWEKKKKGEGRKEEGIKKEGRKEEGIKKDRREEMKKEF